MVDAGGDMMLVSTAANEEGRLAGNKIAPRQGAELPLDRKLARMIGQARDFIAQLRGLGHIDEQIVDRAGTDRRQHGAPVFVGQWQIAHQPGFLIVNRNRT